VIVNRTSLSLINDTKWRAGKKEPELTIWFPHRRSDSESNWVLHLHGTCVGHCFPRRCSASDQTSLSVRNPHKQERGQSCVLSISSGWVLLSASTINSLKQCTKVKPLQLDPARTLRESGATVYEGQSNCDESISISPIGQVIFVANRAFRCGNHFCRLHL
jgi:hypothetical protein